MAIKQKNTMGQASKAKQRVKSIIKNSHQSASVGIAHDNSGYFVKVHLSQPVLEIHNIPSSVEGVIVKTEVVGTPCVY